jgi:NAD(P)-dependent dehydrogenase (short-subunit alcohol dehydrogenase family)
MVAWAPKQAPPRGYQVLWKYLKEKSMPESQTGSLLQGKVAIVTGAAHPKGIGRAIVVAMESQGGTVVASDLNGAIGLEESNGFACDVTDRAQVNALIEHVIAQHGRIDIVVNNAGVGIGNSDFLAITDKEWELSLNVNVRGVANVCQAAIPHMKDSGGSIINVASMAGIGAMTSIPACYTASKFASVGLTKQIAAQFAPDKIRCNALCPGSVITQMHDSVLATLAAIHNISVEQAQALENSVIPLGRSAQPAEVADAAVYLASDLSLYVTGTTLPLAGGMSPGL